jgi:hypothetical protein
MRIDGVYTAIDARAAAGVKIASELSCVQKLFSVVLATSSLHPAFPLQKFYFVLSESMFLSTHSASMRGAFRDRHEREAGSGGCDGVAGRATSIGALRGDLAGWDQARRCHASCGVPSRTANPCGPGIPELMPSSRML